MTDEATEAGGGSSLESILLRRIHWAETEGPALVDRDEFAAHVAVAFDESVPAEAFAARFFAGNPELAAIVPDVAQAFVATVDERLGVYEFELSQLDYVVVENGDKVVVAGEAGQVEARYDESARQAVRAAVIADARVARAAAAPQSRAYLVREDGTVDVLDAGKLAAVLEPLSFRQVAAPVLEQPARRLVRFGPRRRPLSRSAEERVLRENDPRMSLPIGLPEGAAVSERPESAEPAVFLLLPDGSLARPAIGAATRWPQMVSAWTARAALLDVGAPAMRVSGEERFTLTGNRLSALVTRGAGDGPGEVALRSDLRSGALTQVRTDLAPVRILGDDDLAQLVAGGDARLLPGWTAALPVDSYWVQPESWFAPTDQDRALVARLAPASGLDAPAADAMPARTAPASLDVPQAQAPLQAPAADVSVPAATAQPSPALSAPEQVFVQPEPPPVAAPPTAVPALAPATVAPPLAPLAPAPLPIAGPAAAVPIPTRAGAPAPPAVAPVTSAPPRTIPALAPPPIVGLARFFPTARPPLAPLAGALPSPAFEALRLSVERTAAAGAYVIPLETGLRLEFPRRPRPEKPSPQFLPWRRPPIPLPRPPLGRVLVSLPFPNLGEVHVGHDLSHALHAFLTAPVRPIQRRVPPSLVDASDDRGGHARALASARLAALRLGSPEVRDILASQQAVSLLPALLRNALRAAGPWTPGPGAPMPPELRAFAAHGSFAVPEVLASEPISEISAVPRRSLRQLGVGEDEIVVPTPLWAELGRGITGTARDAIFSPPPRSSYAPPLGSSRLAVPFATFSPGFEETVRPAAIRLDELQQHLLPAKPGHLVASAGTDEQLPRRRRRVSIGAPLLHRTSTMTAPESALDGRRGRAPAQQESIAHATMPPAQFPSIEGTIVAPAPGVRPMSMALDEALRISRRLAAQAPRQEAPLSTTDRVGQPSRSAPAAIQAPVEPALATPRIRGEDDIAAGRSAVPGAFALSAWQPYAGDWAFAKPWTETDAGVSRRRVPSVIGTASPLPFPAIQGIAPPRTAAGHESAALRFRYVSAPLWWSASLRSPRTIEEPGPADARASLREAFGSANLAAGLWRSILSRSGEHGVDLSAGMDRRHDSAERELSGVARRIDVLVEMGIVGKAAGGEVSPKLARGPETVYVAIDEQGRAGTVVPGQLQRARSLAQSVDMRVVAAIPPSPPPLESMSAVRGVPDATVPRARQPQAKLEDEADATASPSRIEGSVEAIAQRIYHRVQRRLASDRERFGG